MINATPYQHLNKLKRLLVLPVLKNWKHFGLQFCINELKRHHMRRVRVSGSVVK